MQYLVNLRYLKLFLTFFKIGLFSFGGGYAMIPLIQSEVVLNGWIDFFTLIDFIAVSQSFPLVTRTQSFLDVVPFLDAEQLAKAQAARIIMMLYSLFILLIVFMDVNRKKNREQKN